MKSFLSSGSAWPISILEDKGFEACLRGVTKHRKYAPGRAYGVCRSVKRKVLQKQKKTQKGSGRNYLAERCGYYGCGPVISRQQRQRRQHKVSRNAARRKMARHLGGRCPPHMDVDHINGDPLDNRLVNLRLVPLSRNRRKK